MPFMLGRLGRLVVFCSAVLSVVILRLCWVGSSSSAPSTSFVRPGSQGRCPEPDFANDVLVVLRTGATEALEKLPVHFNTTLRCAPNYVIYSDLEEDIQGYHIYDVLDEVEDGTKNNIEDFEIYRHLHEQGRQGLDEEALSRISAPNGAGNTDNPGWRLDKWKFLPMVSKALNHDPDAKWFVFLEPDTYIIWSNLLEYLTHLDASKPYYLGRHMYIGDTIFGYGGAGFAISNPAMRMVTQHWTDHMIEYNDLIEVHWAGDCVLGKTLMDAGVPLTYAWPHFQDMRPSTFDHATWKTHRVAWCFPAVTYHHVPAEEALTFAAFENNWFREHNGPIRHRDVFRHYILPQLRNEKENWDNLANDVVYVGDTKIPNGKDPRKMKGQIERDAPKSFESCRALCQSQKSCLQFKYTDGKCFVSKYALLGQKTAAESGELEVKSGWMFERAKTWADKMDRTCGHKLWFAP